MVLALVQLDLSFWTQVMSGLNAVPFISSVRLDVVVLQPFCLFPESVKQTGEFFWGGIGHVY